MTPDLPREPAVSRRERVLGAPSIEHVAQVLAESGCDLTRDDQITEVLTANKIRLCTVADHLDEIIPKARALRDQPPGLAEIVTMIWFFAAMVPVVGIATLI